MKIDTAAMVKNVVADSPWDVLRDLVRRVESGEIVLKDLRLITESARGGELAFTFHAVATVGPSADIPPLPDPPPPRKMPYY